MSPPNNVGKKIGDMPILGVGTDIVEIERIASVCEREPLFAEKVFTQAERDYADSKPSKYLHLAARFAAKEAVAKALGGPFGWKEVEVVNNADGKPMVNLYGRAREVAGNAVVHLSVSHTKRYASAVAVVEVGE